MSLDGFVETVDHSLDWTVVDDELHSWFNEPDPCARQMRPYTGAGSTRSCAAYWPTGRRNTASGTEVTREFARNWERNAQDRVFNNSLESVDWNSRLVSGDVGEALRRR